MRFSLVDRPARCLAAIDLLDQCVDALVQGDDAVARRLAAESDIAELRAWFVESQTPSLVFGRLEIDQPQPGPAIPKGTIHTTADSRAVYGRDRWHCRFCSCKVIDPDARDRLRKLLPDLPWGPTNASRHGGLIVHMASTDHVLPRSWGGTNDHTNLVTACWPCQFSRGEYRIEDCGIADPFDRPPVTSDWDGLRRILEVPVPRAT